MSEPLQGTQSAASALDRVRYSHDAMIDMLIANPAITQNELAKAFGYTAPWVSRIMNSDAFNARLAQRKADIVDPTIVLSIDEKLKALASKSLDVVLDKLTLTNSPDLAMKALETTTKALGYGARQNNLNVQQNFVVAMPPKVVDAAAWAAQHAPGGQAGQGSGNLPVPPPPPVAESSVIEGEARHVG